MRTWGAEETKNGGSGEGQTGGFKEQQNVHVCSARVMRSEVEREQGCPIGQAEHSLNSDLATGSRIGV